MFIFIELIELKVKMNEKVKKSILGQLHEKSCKLSGIGLVGVIAFVMMIASIPTAEAGYKMCCKLEEMTIYVPVQDCRVDTEEICWIIEGNCRESCEINTRVEPEFKLECKPQIECEEHCESRVTEVVEYTHIPQCEALCEGEANYMCENICVTEDRNKILYATAYNVMVDGEVYNITFNGDIYNATNGAADSIMLYGTASNVEFPGAEPGIYNIIFNGPDYNATLTNEFCNTTCDEVSTEYRCNHTCWEDMDYTGRETVEEACETFCEETIDCEIGVELKEVQEIVCEEVCDPPRRDCEEILVTKCKTELEEVTIYYCVPKITFDPKEPVIDRVVKRIAERIAKRIAGSIGGDEGYGSLPYAYVEKGLAKDFWVLTSQEYVSLMDI